MPLLQTSREESSAPIVTKSSIETAWPDMSRTFMDQPRRTSVSIVKSISRTPTLYKTTRVECVNMYPSDLNKLYLNNIHSRGPRSVQVLWQVASQKGIKATCQGCS